MNNLNEFAYIFLHKNALITAVRLKRWYGCRKKHLTAQLIFEASYITQLGLNLKMSFCMFR